MTAPERLDPEAERKAAAFIRENLPLTPVPGTGVRLRLAGPGSGLSRLVPPGQAPYWAYAWPGGVALALHLAAQPGVVKGRSVIEIGTGSGLVSIAALRAGAGEAVGFDTDPLAAVAAGLNVEANGVGPFRMVAPEHGLGKVLHTLRSVSEPPVLLAGDVFYDEQVGAQVIASLRSADHDAIILIGDIGRRHLPRDRLEPLACYPVRDVGDPPSAPSRDGWVYRWKPLAGETNRAPRRAPVAVR